ncbi:YitT family protein [Mucilaginibacter sp. L3T2-6]|uniref:YitT family protein n=1 Tax=Mucilaginibacter sp. L3T2-6 TaxID=3062491 RepID=UPI002675CF5F|nr:YitT family protein [Mucilaginibacter sp. L3T2-6]MDO3642980.1 YitT family protein [Mucilaginibacter sp. L3T2-6]MDV6215305.1 YitT family protein [Mucilaginibacter sp. L3T2-6]
MKRTRVKPRKEVTNALFILTGTFSAAFGLKGFLIPNHFIDGGVTGISLLISSITGAPISALIVAINLPFIWLGYKRINKLYAIKTLAAIFVLSVILFLVKFPHVTDDKLLTAVFGGFFLGTGIGLAMRGGCVIDGTELLAVYINPKSFLSVGQIILVINIVIFGIAAFFLGIQSALYSILTYLSASQMINYIVQGFDEYTAVTIISPKSELIKNVIIRQLRRGVTVYKGERGYGKNAINEKDIDILYVVITRLDVSRLVNTVQQIDPAAFIITHSVSEVKGGLIKRHVLSH